MDLVKLFRVGTFFNKLKAWAKMRKQVLFRCKEIYGIRHRIKWVCRPTVYKWRLIPGKSSGTNIAGQEIDGGWNFLYTPQRTERCSYNLRPQTIIKYLYAESGPVVHQLDQSGEEQFLGYYSTCIK